jgi:hypothetical protein
MTTRRVVRGPADLGYTSRGGWKRPGVHKSSPTEDPRIAVRAQQPREKFVYAGELSHSDHKPITDLETGKPQVRFFWSLKQTLSDQLLQELALGVTSNTRRPHPVRKENGSPRSRMPSSFEEFRKGFSYAVGAVSDRIVVPEHYNYQVRLAKFLLERGATVEMERDFVDVAFSIGDNVFIGGNQGHPQSNSSTGVPNRTGANH